MKTIVLDGYNVIHVIPELERTLDRGLEAARHALVQLCAAYRQKRGDVDALYVVFDGQQQEHDQSRRHVGDVTLIFTPRGEEADERILQLIKDDRGRHAFLVISNDVVIVNNARAHGARVMSVAKFYTEAKPRKTMTARQAPTIEKAPLSLRDANRVTEAYRDFLERKAKGPRGSDLPRA